MQADLRRRLERAVRVREFFRTHQSDGATQTGAVALLDDLTTTLNDFEQTLEATRVARLDRAGATSDLRAVLGEISLQVRVLDGLVRYRFGDNGELMGAWATAHNVDGPFRKASPGGNEAGGSTTAAA